MNASVFFPSQLHWTAQQLADAVPLRLHELFAFDAHANANAAGDSANAFTPSQQPQPGKYLPATPAPDVFRIR